MISKTAHLFTDEILQAALDHFGISPEPLISHEGFCSHVYEAQLHRTPIILKLSHSSRVSLQALQSEIEFAAHLSQAQVPVCTPLISSDDILGIPDGLGGDFFAYLYEKVEGTPFDETHASEEDFQAAGRTFALFHDASRSFDHRSHPSRPSFLDRDFLDFERILPQEELATRECFHRIIDELKALQLNSHWYGMTHGDAHDGNVLLSQPNAFLIDLDDIEPGYYLNDVAVFIDSACEPGDSIDSQRVKYVFSNFLRGYSEIDRPSPELWMTLPLFMRFRWIMDHCVFQIMRGHLVKTDPKLRTIRENRIMMYRTGFPQLSYLYDFDFKAAAIEALD